MWMRKGAAAARRAERALAEHAMKVAPSADAEGTKRRLDGRVVRHVERERRLGIGVGVGRHDQNCSGVRLGGVAGGSRERGVGFGLAGLGAEPPPLSDLPSFGGVAVEDVEGCGGGEAACRSVQPQAAGILASVCDEPVREPPPPPLPG